MSLLSKNKLGFIGFGKMGQAIWRGLQKPDVLVYEKESSPNDLVTLVTNANIIFFCVKPQNIADIFDQFPKTDISQKCLISILAGTPISTFEKHLGKNIQMVRVMPNTPAILGAGMSVLSFKNVSENFQRLAIEIFSSLGKTEILSEEMLDVVTGISGSGPAFMYRIADDIAKAGQSQGLNYSQALKLIAQTMVGAGKMLMESKKTPQELIAEVSSPGGTTLAGLSFFDKSHIDHDIQQVVLAAITRARELGK